MSSKHVPVGLEKVLYVAATDEPFRRQLMQDRQRAIRQMGLQLRPSELATLAAIPTAQLQAAIQGMDTSPGNVQRRTFMRVVAASAATVATAGALGCNATPAGIRPDMQDDVAKTSKDGGKDGGKDGAGNDTVKAPGPDGGMAGTGIRPGG